ncbi:TEF transcription factor, PAR bZIP family member a isoform X2 [Trichomycterus rosablanca]|uniref:TEF transcription factor, PAR bZIP family member a isoform X2 n=1 Tax=Trichomycterus rosablanca TaxID=2290929 RepID=UPI002F356F76
MSCFDMPSDIPDIFKALLEQPFPFAGFNENENDKEKISGDEADSGSGVSDLGPSAALTPAIWDKTIPYDGKTFHLEYMDLDEFLIENGINSSSEEVQGESPSEKNPLEKAPTTILKADASLSAPVTLVPATELEQCDEEVSTTIVSKSESTETKTGLPKECLTPDQIDPEEIEVSVNFEPDPADLVLSTIPGEELFDPRKHRFSEEELKPQPMIKKARKIFVPEDLKDDKYWQRRKKNNVAANRSREARRLKENQIAVRAAFLERENSALRLEVAQLRKNLGHFKTVVTSYETKYGKP